MKTSKITIRKKIFFSHITIITISLLLTFVSFNLYLNFYVEKQTRKQLIEVAKSIEKSMVEASMDLNINQNFKEPINTDKNLSIINKNLKNTESFLDVNYAIIGTNMELIYPEKKE